MTTEEWNEIYPPKVKVKQSSYMDYIKNNPQPFKYTKLTIEMIEDLVKDLFNDEKYQEQNRRLQEAWRGMGEGAREQTRAAFRDLSK